MKYVEKEPAVLVLEDGTVFHGHAAGKKGTTTGEIAFNTGMTGYQEIFSDPSYFGQIVVMTAAHIGNYGVHTSEVESQGNKIAGMVCKNFSPYYSRAAGETSLQDYFEQDGLVGICDVDTRALVRHIRNKGAMNCIISSATQDIEELKTQLKQVPSMAGLELSTRVATTEVFEREGEGKHRVALLDLGVKESIISCLTDRGCTVKVFPTHTKADEIMAWSPDGIMFSNGPGDPSAMPEVVQEVGKLIDTEVPCFGICLGHQVMALSQGLKTEKMFNGHRGINHPILNMETGKGEITSQNHGFVVQMESAEAADGIEVTHKHLNDNTLAGIRIKGKQAFSVQYHPEASPGPHDSRYLFDQFIREIIAAKEEIVSKS